MALPAGNVPPKLFVSRFRDILESVGDVLQMQLQVWTQRKEPVATLNPPQACVRCSTVTPEVFSLCQQRRRNQTKEALRRGRADSWVCDKGLRLAALPIQTEKQSLGALVAVDDSPVSTGPEAPAEVSSKHERKKLDPTLTPVWLRADLGLRSAPTESGSGKGDKDSLTKAPKEMAYEGLEPQNLAGLGREAQSSAHSKEKDPGEPEDTSQSHCVIPFPRLGDADAGSSSREQPPADEKPPEFQKKLIFLRDLVRLISEQMSMSMEMQSMTEELYTRSEEISMLTSVTGRLAQFEDVRQNIAYILQQAMRTVEADAGAINVMDRKILETSVKIASGTDLACLDSRGWHRLGTGLKNTLTWSESRSFLGRPSLLGQEDLQLPDSWQILGVGFPESGTLNGYLTLIRCSSRRFELNDLRLLRSLVHQVEVTVSNADLYDNLKNFLIATVKSLVHAIEAKDSITSGHSERVNILSMLLGKTLGLDEQTLEVLRWSSLLHDVGKIGMPECILLKPGELTPEEYEVVKEHPERGYRILSPVQQLQVAADGVRSHHEMVNGEGYPFGLIGEEIPFLARIIAVADTYDALTQTRPYRKGRPVSAAMEEIRRVRGSQLDPEVLDALEKLVPFLEENQIMIDAVSRAA
jgi:HD-GYP domain-containing protein (c-di-GMP phosphodiesterase class II)